jgi:hypothetical protein
MVIEQGGGKAMYLYDSNDNDRSYQLLAEGESNGPRRRLVSDSRKIIFAKVEFDPISLNFEAEAEPGPDGKIMAIGMTFTPDFGGVSAATQATVSEDGTVLEQSTLPTKSKLLKHQKLRNS